MIDVKKLITGFLILAVAAGASGIILSFINVGGSSATAETSAGAQIGGVASSSPAAMNAFVDTGTIQGNAAEVVAATDTSSTKAAVTDPTNLTNVFADSFLDGLVAANPNGLITDESGTPAFNTPDTQAIAVEIANDPAMQSFKAPNWTTEANTQLIKTISSSSSVAITQYADSLNSIFNKYFVSTELQNLIKNNTSDPSNLSYISTQVQSALNDTLALQVPSSLAAFQKSLIKVMVYEKDSANLGQIATTDPIKASLILQNEQSQYAIALTDLQNQMKQTSQLGLLFDQNIPSSSVPFIAQLFGVQPAHAIFGVGDITFDPATFGELVLTYAENSVLQILKNTLVSLIQRKVLTWIQGSGAPRFVTDWGSELVNSFQTAALNTLNNEISCVPSYQAPILRVMLSTPYMASNSNNSCAAEFQGQLGNNLANLGNLYDNFTNFNDYFAIMGPAGNTWSNLITIHDSAIAAGNNSQTAKTNQNNAQQGWLGSQVCTDGSDPANGTHEYCKDGSVPNISANGDICNDGSVAAIIPNGGRCADGSEPKTTSPGQVTGQSMAAVLKGGLDNITSASSITGILDALLTSLLNTLSQNAINYSTQVINADLNGTSVPNDPGVTGIPPSNITTTPPASAQVGVQCLPSIQNATISTSTGQAAVSLSAGGGKIDTACATNGTCPSSENSDGTPIYNWSAPGSAQAGTPVAGSSILLSYTTPGTYTVTVSASTDNSTASCEIDVQ